jgi:hypothetical protein
MEIKPKMSLITVPVLSNRETNYDTKRSIKLKLHPTNNEVKTFGDFNSDTISNLDGRADFLKSSTPTNH